jgi:hypothetical protein
LTPPATLSESVAADKGGIEVLEDVHAVNETDSEHLCKLNIEPSKFTAYDAVLATNWEWLWTKPVENTLRLLPKAPCQPSAGIFAGRIKGGPAQMAEEMALLPPRGPVNFSRAVPVPVDFRTVPVKSPGSP